MMGEQLPGQSNSDGVHDAKMLMGQYMLGFMEETDEAMIELGDAVEAAVIALAHNLRARGIPKDQVASFVVGGAAAALQSEF